MLNHSNMPDELTESRLHAKCTRRDVQLVTVMMLWDINMLLNNMFDMTAFLSIL